MLGKIISIKDNIVGVALEADAVKVSNLVNYHVILEENNFKIVGEIQSVTGGIANITLVGEIRDGRFISGIIRRPSFISVCRIINQTELDIIIGNNILNGNEKLHLGKIPLYNNYPIDININTFFSNHFAIFGNTGSGKSYSVARILQNIFYRPDNIPNNANIFIFDVYGEYHNAFSKLEQYSPELNFKRYTTKLKFPDTEILSIPLWLLGVDDIALLLGADNHFQLPIIEKALRLVSIFAKDEADVIVYKNDIIARALLEILYSGRTPAQIRDQIFAVLSVFNTKDLNLDSKVVQQGYGRPLRHCLIIDNAGKLNEIRLVTEFLTSFTRDNLQLNLPDGSFPYTLKHLKDAFDFALISEGILQSDKVYDYANILKVRLHSIVNSDSHKYFDYPEYITKENYIKKLLTTPTGKKAQIINFNISYIDDRFAKVITKIYSKMLYEYVAEMSERATFPIHIILEEAHRYVQNDNDNYLLGYNIFDRITKEGRKYGILLGLISQRPSELSETALSQCSNFLVFKVVYPRDAEFIKNMLPIVTYDTIDKLKILQPGSCIAFGNAFPLPITISFDLPDPAPSSSNANIGSLWFGKKEQ
jgi:DNA helicase HerA-like ATPase